jgi:dTDP-glucose pyrophosphorylase
MKYKVCILAAGSGSRLNNLSKIHKSLLPINERAIISSIIEQFDKTIEIVIAIGSKHQQIQEYLRFAYPKKKIKFVRVKNYAGIGSGPGRSLLSCKKYLNCPFIFTSCDTLVKNKIHPPKLNWIGVDKVEDPEDYLIVHKSKNELINLVDKKKKTYFRKQLKDFSKKFDAFIGLAGIKDYKIFWKNLSQDNKLIKKEYQVSNGLKGLIEKKIQLKKFQWLDTGNQKNYLNAKKSLEKNQNLIKEGQFFYIEKDVILKYFDDKELIKNLVYRSKFIKNCPKIKMNCHNFFVYNYQKGRLLSETNNNKIFKNFLEFMKLNFWKINKTFNYEKVRLNNYCKFFYEIKTKERVKKYFKEYNDIDKEHIINGIKVPKLKKLFSLIDWKELNNAIPVTFHGDLQPENIIYNKNKFYLIDWRDQFFKNKVIGDIYYEFSKLHHALVLSNRVIRENAYFVKEDKKKTINYYFKKRKNLLNYKHELEDYIKKNDYSLKKVELFSALIYLNIAALHHYPYNKLLFFHGKLTLYKVLLKYKLI